jgi:hypothetical protein
VSVARRQWEIAARLLGIAAQMRDEIGVSLAPICRADHEQAMVAARSALGAQAFERHWQIGQEQKNYQDFVSLVFGLVL